MAPLAFAYTTPSFHRRRRRFRLQSRRHFLRQRHRHHHSHLRPHLRPHLFSPTTLRSVEQGCSTRLRWYTVVLCLLSTRTNRFLISRDLPCANNDIWLRRRVKHRSVAPHHPAVSLAALRFPFSTNATFFTRFTPHSASVSLTSVKSARAALLQSLH